MVLEKEIQDNVESHLKLLVNQTETFLPFIKVAFPYTQNLSDACYGMIAGNALSVFINQYAIRMRYPTYDDFIEFGKIVSKYREQVDAFFK